MIAAQRLADVFIVGHVQIAASVDGLVEVLCDGELIADLKSELGEDVFVIGVYADGGVVNLPLGVAANRAAADDGVVARLIQRVTVVSIEIEVHSGEGIGKRLGLLAALAVHPGKVAKGEGSRLGGGLLGRCAGSGDCGYRRGGSGRWRRN